MTGGHPLDHRVTLRWHFYVGGVRIYTAPDVVVQAPDPITITVNGVPHAIPLESRLLEINQALHVDASKEPV